MSEQTTDKLLDVIFNCEKGIVTRMLACSELTDRIAALQARIAQAEGVLGCVEKISRRKLRHGVTIYNLLSEIQAFLKEVK